VAIDDHLRVGFNQTFAGETGGTACISLLRALRYYQCLGVRIAQVTTNSDSAYKSRRFTRMLRHLDIRHIRSRPYMPRTNGKTGRFIRTLLREWVYVWRFQVRSATPGSMN